MSHERFDASHHPGPRSAVARSTEAVPATGDSATRVRESRRLPRVRTNLLNLDDAELLRLRRAFAGLYKISTDAPGDERGYQWIAGVHGYPPPVYCMHGNDNFPTWHRAYLYEFELRLQMIDPSVVLPYWAWNAPEAAETGLPPALADETYVDPDSGETLANPLYSAWSQVDQGYTQRSPSDPSQLELLADQVETALDMDNYSDFSSALENPHGGLHVWVGGDMGSVPTAAYDPVFWLHHANVDRIWWQWQERHGGVEVPESVRRFVCAPFPYVGEETLDTEFFGYTYAESETYMVPSDAEERKIETADTLPPVAVFPIDRLPERFVEARLEFHGLEKTRKSYTVRVFVGPAGAEYGADTPTRGNPHFANSLFLFGHGEECPGAEGHCDPTFDQPRLHFDRRHPHHLAPYDTFVDVTRAVREARDQRKDSLRLYFVVVGTDGQPVPYTVVDYEGMALVTY